MNPNYLNGRNRMNHKIYVKQINREKALNNHNQNHREAVEPDCEYCEIFPKAMIVIRATRGDSMFVADSRKVKV